MFKILLLVFLGWLAFRMIKAGRFVRGIMRTMEQTIAAAQGQEMPPTGRPRGSRADRPNEPADDGTRITVHRKSDQRAEGGTLEAEDVRFEDL
ncbi:MAG: hypothetical protein ACI9W4_001507 [Rhodothermales bacterium]|jgi:hypothetical protein